MAPSRSSSPPQASHRKFCSSQEAGRRRWGPQAAAGCGSSGDWGSGGPALHRVRSTAHPDHALLLRAAGGAAVRLSAKPFVTAALLLISAVCPRSARHVLFSGDTHVQAGLATPSGRLARGWLARAGRSARFSQAQKGVCKPTQVIRQRGGVAGGNVRQPRCALVGRRGAAGTGATTLCTYPHVRPCRHCRPCPSIMNVREARAVRKGTSRAVQNAKRRPLVACVPFTSHANWMPCLPSCKQSYTCQPHLRMLQLAMQQQAAVAVQRTRIALALLRLHLKTAGQIQCRRRPIAGLHVHCTASRGR